MSAAMKSVRQTVCPDSKKGTTLCKCLPSSHLASLLFPLSFPHRNTVQLQELYMSHSIIRPDNCSFGSTYLPWKVFFPCCLGDLGSLQFFCVYLIQLCPLRFILSFIPRPRIAWEWRGKENQGKRSLQGHWTWTLGGKEGFLLKPGLGSLHNLTWWALLYCTPPWSQVIQDTKRSVITVCSPRPERKLLGTKLVSVAFPISHPYSSSPSPTKVREKVGKIFYHFRLSL